MLAKLGKLKRRIENREFRYLIKRMFPRGNWILYWGDQLIFKLDNKDKFSAIYSSAKKQSDHHIETLDHSSIDQLCDDFPKYAEIFRARINRGDSCYVSKINGYISGYLWASALTKSYFNTNSLWQFAPEQESAVWYYDGFVKPEHRRQGLFPYLMGAVHHDYLKNGCQAQFGETDKHNQKSVNSHLRSGYVILWHILFVSIFGLKIYFVRNKETGSRGIDFRYILNIEKFAF